MEDHQRRGALFGGNDAATAGRLSAPGGAALPAGVAPASLMPAEQPALAFYPAGTGPFEGHDVRLKRQYIRG